MKVKSIEIVGFRGIPKLTLEFSDRVNVIVGVNGAGKSAILDCIVDDHAKARVFARLDGLAWWRIDRRGADLQC